MADKGKKRDDETGKEDGMFNRFTQQMRQLRAQHDESTFMNGEDTPEEADMKKRKKELERMAKQGMR